MDIVVKKDRGGRPPKNPRTWLAQQKPTLTARWVRSCRRALRHLNDPSVPITKEWISLFNSLSDRLGYERSTTQHVDATSISATVSAETVIAGLAERARRIEAHFGKPLPEVLSSMVLPDEDAFH